LANCRKTSGCLGLQWHVHPAQDHLAPDPKSHVATAAGCSMGVIFSDQAF